jgi:hypothetical protein
MGKGMVVVMPLSSGPVPTAGFEGPKPLSGLLRLLTSVRVKIDATTLLVVTTVYWLVCAVLWPDPLFGLIKSIHETKTFAAIFLLSATIGVCVIASNMIRGYKTVIATISVLAIAAIAYYWISDQILFALVPAPNEHFFLRTPYITLFIGKNIVLAIINVVLPVFGWAFLVQLARLLLRPHKS